MFVIEIYENINLENKIINLVSLKKVNVSAAIIINKQLTELREFLYEYFKSKYGNGKSTLFITFTKML